MVKVNIRHKQRRVNFSERAMFKDIFLYVVREREVTTKQEV